MTQNAFLHSKGHYMENNIKLGPIQIRSDDNYLSVCDLFERNRYNTDLRQTETGARCENI